MKCHSSDSDLAEDRCHELTIELDSASATNSSKSPSFVFRHGQPRKTDTDFDRLLATVQFDTVSNSTTLYDSAALSSSSTGATSEQSNLLFASLTENFHSEKDAKRESKMKLRSHRKRNASNENKENDHQPEYQACVDNGIYLRVDVASAAPYQSPSEPAEPELSRQSDKPSELLFAATSTPLLANPSTKRPWPPSPLDSSYHQASHNAVNDLSADVSELSFRHFDANPTLAVPVETGKSGLFATHRRRKRSCFVRMDFSMSILVDDDPLDKLLIDYCALPSVQALTNIITPTGPVRKIGEGSYGEVFINSDDSVVTKIVPIGGCSLINGAHPTGIADMLAEVAISDALSRLNGRANFVHVESFQVHVGPYPTPLLHAWDKFDGPDSRSENERPDVLPDSQLFMALGFANGGSDLDGVTDVLNADVCLSIFAQTAFSLAVGEQELELEHRDLHCGNILISKSESAEHTYTLTDSAISRASGTEFNLSTFKVKTHDVRVTLIDFSLTRLCYKNELLFNDLHDDADLFNGVGDYQFEVYRMMKKEIEGPDGSGQWSEFRPKTNVFWLHYLTTKILARLASGGRESRANRQVMSLFRQMETSMLKQCNSAVDVVRLYLHDLYML